MMTPISEIIFSGFVSKIVNNSVDSSWSKIKKVVQDKNTDHQNIECQIYNIIVNVLNQMSYNKNEDNGDKIYQAAESILLGYKNVKRDDIEIVRSGLHILGTDVDNDIYKEFKNKVYEEIGKKENIELYHIVLLWLLEQKNNYDKLVIEQLNQKLNAVLKILGIEESEPSLQQRDIRFKINSRSKEYADKWNQNMFLNDFDKRDKNAGINVKLGETYLEQHLPKYIWCGNGDEPFADLKELLSEYIIEKRDSKMLLIFGQPGIGKSTLITWITVNFFDEINDILVYKFAPDLGEIAWDNEVSKKILEELGLKHEELNGKVLIIDGFDEVSIESNNRRRVLDDLYGNWVYNDTIKNFSLIITCRENYVREFAVLKCKYITLQPWDEVQIASFCDIFQKNTQIDISEETRWKIYENKEILGIPLILYMVLALNISIDQEGSIVDVYDKIFSLEGGIYDRCIDNKKFADNHRIGEIKKQIHQISREIALWMFDNNHEEAVIPQSAYKKICTNIMTQIKNQNDDFRFDFLIGNYFKLIRHCEGIETEELSFVHRSIYEYFVVEFICNNIIDTILENRESDDLPEKIACICGLLLKGNRLSISMLDYMQRKIRNSILNDNFSVINKAFQMMLNEGMTYYTSKCFKNIMNCERNVFANVLEILHLWNNEVIVCNEKIADYIHFNWGIELNLKGMDLKKINLRRVNLSGMNLEDANLEDADLEEANLSYANLKGANLKNANLRNTILNNTNLTGTCFYRTKLDDVNLKEAKINVEDVDGAIYHEELLIGENIVGSGLLKEY